ncbi:hypoxanthine phosphoribosyltransferase [Desulfovibrio inopinatus]|uniref:hypoxanthine phosphoribosyltransferase n=1 Tax=Desulfovibrio inopinatus TaxID=102109 RepID=UPI0003FF3EF6|nr:hypoxanthine phosphoribosyltransferase [Desulfovibrio inopinatus]
MGEHTRQVMYSREEIAARVAELGREISEYYKDKQCVMVGVLNGVIVFYADLLRSMSFCPEVDFVRVKSYGAKDTPDEIVTFTKDVEVDIQGKDLLLVEDIVDSGQTIDFLRRIFLERGPRSVKICALLDKTGRRRVDVPVDFYGFRLEDGFVIGYGLDFAEDYRHLKDIEEIVKF